MAYTLVLNPITGELDLVNQAGDAWVFNSVPTGTINGINLIFEIAEAASEIVVYADGMRAVAADYSLTGTTLTFASGRQPFSSLTVDYLV